MRIGTKYEVTGTLGEGGMGVVYQARQIELGHLVAIKVLRSEAAADPETVQRFHREARIAAQLRSSHSARVLDFGTTDEGFPYMVLEHLVGHDLDRELEARGALPMAEAIGYVLEACEALREAHDLGVVHRDLKPSNFFLADEAGKRVVKLLDFGISKLASEEKLSVTRTQSSFGTPLYMSPEHMRSAKSVDKRTDIWSLGVILYELCTGMPPFVAESATAVAVAVATEVPTPPSQRVAGLPPQLDEVILRALEKDPSARYSDVNELGIALRAVIGLPAPSLSALPPRMRSDAATLSVLTTTPDRQTKGRSRVGLFVGVGALGGLLVVGLLLLILPPGDGAKTTGEEASAADSSVAPRAEPSAVVLTDGLAAVTSTPELTPVAPTAQAAASTEASAAASAKPPTTSAAGPKVPATTATAKAATPPATGKAVSPAGKPPAEGNRDSQGRPIVL